MKKLRKSKPLCALIIAGIALVVASTLGRIPAAIAAQSYSPYSTNQAALTVLFGAIYILIDAGSMFLASLLVIRAMIKRRLPTAAAALLSLAAGAVLYAIIIIFMRIPQLVSISGFTFWLAGIPIFFLFGSLIMNNVRVNRRREAREEQERLREQEEESAVHTANLGGGQAGTAYHAASGSIDGLSDALLKVIKPTLKAPLTAVLCGDDELLITDVKGGYHVEGYVSSQNSYGAMISTVFSATARQTAAGWAIGDLSVGVKRAVEATKSFVGNYILISIIVAVMGGVGYLILKLIFDF